MGKFIPIFDIKESSICRCLDDIRKLIAERDKIALEDSFGAATIQREIFRKFAILDWQLSTVSGSAWKWRKMMLIPLIKKVRKQAKAGNGDLKKMVIPICSISHLWERRISRDECVDGSPCQKFHLFQRLPPELQEKILNKIVCPCCKLGIAEAIPTAERLMQWDLTNIKFELVFAVLMKKRKLSSSDIDRLRKVNFHIRESINEYFESWLVSKDDRFFNKWRTWPTMQIAAVPVPVDAQYPFLARMYLDDFTPDIFHLLKLVGPAIWDCQLDLDWIELHTLVNTNHVLTECLSRMPNLRRLEIKSSRLLGDKFSEEELAEWHHIEKLPLPRLTKLQNLNMFRVYEEGGALVVQRMLKQYGKNLRTLSVKSSGLVENTKPCGPRLTTLFIETNATEPTNLYKKLQTFSGSPLRLIDIDVHGNEEKLGNQITKLFAYGLSSFQGTLENLSVTCSMVHLTVGEDSTSNLKWTPCDLCFPKLRYLDLSYIRGNWLWLLQFPALEELHIEKDSDAPCVFPPKNPLNLSWSKEGILKSSVWKLLPSLHLIRLNFDDWPQPRLTITRGEWRSFQEKIQQDGGHRASIKCTGCVKRKMHKELCR